MTTDDALAFLVYALRSDEKLDNYGYDVWLGHVIDRWVTEHVPEAQRKDHVQTVYDATQELSPAFFAAAWELCRRGILRPGVRRARAQVTETGSGGMGYSVTPFGREWLRAAEPDALAAVIPARYIGLLAEHAARFGAGYLGRGSEAVRCYSAHAYLACCAMCGAAAESILLARAGEIKPEAEVLAMYAGTGGRGRVERLVVGRATDQVKREFSSFLVLLKYWRDDAAHGRASTISETEGFTSLMLLGTARTVCR